MSRLLAIFHFPWAAEYIYRDNGDTYKITLTGKSEAAFTYTGNPPVILLELDTSNIRTVGFKTVA